MNARRLAVELQLSAKRGTASGEQVNAVVETLLEMADKLERLEAENAGLQERIENQRRKLEHAQTPEYVAALEAENTKLRELIRMMLRVAGVAEYATDIEWQTITHYLRELGIEVDE